MAKNPVAKAKGKDQKTNKVSTSKMNVPAKAGSKSLAVAGAFESMAGHVTENVTNKDLLISRMTIIQALSPQKKKSDAAYIKEAEEGDFCDVDTNELFKGEFIFLPVFYAMIYLEWAPRST